jgi:hypothetical protein
MPPTAKKATPAAAKPAQEPEKVTPDPASTPDLAAAADGTQEPADGTDTADVDLDTEDAADSDFCPDAGVCFPYGIPEGTTAAGCIHGDWIFE